MVLVIAPCPHCNGTGRVVVVEPDLACEATITIGSETISCYANRSHPGEPHMAIVCAPCADCGGYDEHHSTCGTYDMLPWKPGQERWWSWSDGDLALTPAGRSTGGSGRRCRRDRDVAEIVDDLVRPLWRDNGL